MHGKVISLSRGTGANRRRLFALVDRGERPGQHNGFALFASDPEDEAEAWLVVQGPHLDAAFLQAAFAAGWNTELVKLGPPPPLHREWESVDGT